MSPTAKGQPSPAQQRLQQEQAARRRHDRRVLGLIALALVLVLVGGGVALQAWRTGRAPSAAPVSAGSDTPVRIVAGQPILLGRVDAPVRMRLYEDFHCPHCADFEERLGATISSEQAAGRLAVELYPMSFFDQGSAPAANAVACAAESGFGQAYHAGLFANHTLRWSDDQLTGLAAQVASPVPAGFDACVTGGAHQAWVDSINTAVEGQGVTSTPTVLLGDRQLDFAALTPQTLSSMIAAEAAGEGAR